jgi:hypothetical protein
MSLKIENSRRVAESRPVCMGLKAGPNCMTGLGGPPGVSRNTGSREQTSTKPRNDGVFSLSFEIQTVKRYKSH